MSGRTFYSFCGTQRVCATHRLAETASILLDAAAREGLAPELRLIAEEEADALAALGFAVTPDRDSFD